MVREEILERYYPSEHKVISGVLCVIGILFLTAGVSKLFPLAGFLDNLRAYNLPVPFQILQYCSIPLICLEIWIGSCLILRANLKVVLIILQALLLFMIPILIWGTLNEAPSCGCYGQTIEREPWIAIIEDLGILLLTFYCYKRMKLNKTSNNKYKQIIACTLTAGGLVYSLLQIC